MAIFKDYLEWKNISLSEERKYMSHKHSVLKDPLPFPLPDYVINAVNMVEERRRGPLLKWIFTKGLQNALVKRREIANKLKEQGLDVGQDGVFSPHARNENPQLSQLDNDIQDWWDFMGGEPDIFDDINAHLRSEGKKPMLFGGKDGLIEYLENGTWRKKANLPHFIHPRYGKQGYGLDLPDDENYTGKWKNPKSSGYQYRFGLAKGLETGKYQGSFVPPTDVVYWTREINRAQQRSLNLASKIADDIKSGNQLDSEEINWLKQKIDNNEIDKKLGQKILNGKLDFDEKQDAVWSIFSTDKRRKTAAQIDQDQSETDILKNANPKTLASMKALLQHQIKSLILTPPVDENGTYIPTNKGVAAGPDWGTGYISVSGTKDQGSKKFTIPNPESKDPLERAEARKFNVDETAAKIASLLLPDNGAPSPGLYCGHINNGKPTRWGPVTTVSLLDNSKKSRDFVKKGFDKIKEPLSTEFRGQNYTFDPKDILQDGNLKKTINKIAKHTSYIINPVEKKEVDLNVLQAKGYQIEAIPNSNGLAYATKGDEKKLLRRKSVYLKNGDFSTKWYEVEAKTDERFPILPDTLRGLANTAVDLKQSMSLDPKDKKVQEIWNDFIQNPEKYGESPSQNGLNLHKIKGGDTEVPQSVKAGVNVIGNNNERGDSSWRSEAANNAMIWLQMNMNNPQFYYGNLDPTTSTRFKTKAQSSIKTNLMKSMPEEEADQVLSVLKRELLTNTKTPIANDETKTVQVTPNQVLVNPEIMELLLQNGFNWRKGKATQIASNHYYKQMSIKDRATGAIQNSDGDEFNVDYEDEDAIDHNRDYDWEDDDDIKRRGDDFDRDSGMSEFDPEDWLNSNDDTSNSEKEKEFEQWYKNQKRRIGDDEEFPVPYEIPNKLANYQGKRQVQAPAAKPEPAIKKPALETKPLFTSYKKPDKPPLSSYTKPALSSYIKPKTESFKSYLEWKNER